MAHDDPGEQQKFEWDCVDLAIFLEFAVLVGLLGAIMAFNKH